MPTPAAPSAPAATPPIDDVDPLRVEFNKVTMETPQLRLTIEDKKTPVHTDIVLELYNSIGPVFYNAIRR
ncbi:unnamed protein product [Absidia cylindrospora]